LAFGGGFAVALAFAVLDCFNFLFCLLVSQGGVESLRDALCARVTGGVAIGAALLAGSDWRKDRRVV